MTQVWNVWEGAATLGEGPVWDTQRNQLWFVDIKQRKIHRFDPCAKAVRSWDAPGQIGWVLPAADGTLIAGLQQGLARFDPNDGSFEVFAEVEPEQPSNRLNDATVGPDGTIWFGSMDDGEENDSGRFYRWNGKSVRPVDLEPVCITNGPALSPDGRKLYHVDTAGGVINVATLDEAGKVLENREFARIDPADGHPDGCIVDSRGNVWVGLWGGWRARLYSPDGTVLQEVKLPASNVTKIALGGKDLTTAYATTARAGLSEEELAGQPEAGSLFAFKVDVPGLCIQPANVATSVN
ncbi:SMP-30/gluconolactonase/LRE family protein [Tsuneonella mangrovi]|uniref:SMP-30/gluconolactonase/LRE family protein n=1 Tax=Tsuneonella mangrovi TaxID=1982042 RepID=UPI000BA20763|nr:SMP-30/gluconolactonase/LRE family protein [Tsuneonella mangrovi]